MDQNRMGFLAGRHVRNGNSPIPRNTN
jgi:hypothetical protein